MNKMLVKSATMFIVGLVIGIFVMSQLDINKKIAPANHQAIIDNIFILDTVYSSSLSPELVEAVKTPQLAVTTPGESYEHSVWVWYTLSSRGYSGKDANVAMELWGPLDDGSYGVGLAKLAGNELKVYYKTQEVAVLGAGTGLTNILVDSSLSYISTS